MQIDIEIEFATRTTFDLIIDSKHNIIDVEFELKLIANFSNLNDLKNLFNLIFDCDLKTTTISCSIVFFTTTTIVFALEHSEFATN